MRNVRPPGRLFPSLPGVLRRGDNKIIPCVQRDHPSLRRHLLIFGLGGRQENLSTVRLKRDNVVGVQVPSRLISQASKVASMARPHPGTTKEAIPYEAERRAMVESQIRRRGV